MATEESIGELRERVELLREQAALLKEIQERLDNASWSDDAFEQHRGFRDDLREIPVLLSKDAGYSEDDFEPYRGFADNLREIPVLIERAELTDEFMDKIQNTADNLREIAEANA